MTLQVTLAVVVSFWITASIGMWWQERSWFPFTLIVPFVLIVGANAVDRFLPGFGFAIVTCLHLFLWFMLAYVVVRDWMKHRRV